jgi:hypothetical protein
MQDAERIGLKASLNVIIHDKYCYAAADVIGSFCDIDCQFNGFSNHFYSYSLISIFHRKKIKQQSFGMNFFYIFCRIFLQDGVSCLK